MGNRIDVTCPNASDALVVLKGLAATGNPSVLRIMERIRNWWGNECQWIEAADRANPQGIHIYLHNGTATGGYSPSTGLPVVSLTPSREAVRYKVIPMEELMDNYLGYNDV